MNPRDSVLWLVVAAMLVIGIWLAIHSAPPAPYLAP
jgi:hypothetical protein